MHNIEIAGHMVGNGLKPFIIAEVGQAHDGSLGLAHCFIEAAARAGVDAIKFQTHIAREESTLDEPFRVKFSRQDNTRFDYWRRMEFSPNEWAGLNSHAEEKGLVFLSSPFSIPAVDLLEKLGVAAWKIGSGEFWSEELLNTMMAKGKPLLVSTGMSRWAELAEIAEKLSVRKYPFALFQCTSRYPTTLHEIGLNVIERIQREIGCPTGLSDHSGSLYPALAAMARGAAIIEVHITLSRDMFGPDVSSSLTTEEITQLVRARDAFFTMDRHPVDKDRMADELSATRSLFSKSIALAESLPAGTVLERRHLRIKKPGTGIPASEIENIIGKRLQTDAPLERLLKWENIE